MELKFKQLVERLGKSIDSKRIITDKARRLTYGTDASFYRLIPELVILVHNEAEVAEILKQASLLNIAVTFRAAGTSLSGQAISDSVLIVATHGWKNHRVFNNNSLITLEPGIIGSKANSVLAPLGLKIGPDPASIASAMIGGIVANNASGMCCGTAQNAYRTLSNIKLVFYDGVILNTADENSIAEFKKKHPEIISEIENLRDEIKADQTLFQLIKDKFKIKNTTGYSINALVDFDDPIEIIKHLLVGSEGTLGFIANVTLQTVTEEKHKSCTMMIFNTIKDACDATYLLKSSPVSAVELLDRDSIRSVENDPESPAYFKTLPESACVLLVDCRDNDPAKLLDKQLEIRKSIASIATLIPYEFTTNQKDYDFNWKARKGLLPTVGSMRKTGTTVIIEDVAFPLKSLADATIDLKALFKKYEYTDAYLFGHALEGNLHFVFSQDFSLDAEVKRYAGLMADLAVLVVDKYNGSLKAEHGTGRNMAPFVEKEWGEKAYLIMKRIKSIFDPQNIINPGVLINSDSDVHLKNLKPLPEVSELVDKCMECGFCEPNCVAEGLTLSPRQRIVLAREISRLEKTNENPIELAQYKKDAQYLIDDTCAVDGLCALACPVKINTGSFVKEWRAQHVSNTSLKVASVLANNMGKVTASMRFSLDTVALFQQVLGNKSMSAIAGTARKLSRGAIPLWTSSMPAGAPKVPICVPSSNENKVVYFPSCINRSMGKSEKYDPKEAALMEKTIELLQRAGYTVLIPENVENLCCGMPFSSKGFMEQAKAKSDELEAALMKASENGKWQVLYDMSPCFQASKEHFNPALKIIDPIEFMLDYVMPRMPVIRKKEVVTVFPVCSVKKINMTDKLLALSKLCADKVVMVESNCCGFAGDRGFTVPELNAHGQRDLKEQIPANCKVGYSTSRTCEIGMETHSGINFKSIFYLIDEVTK
jgi:D-lactate dehydrogenase